MAIQYNIRDKDGFIIHSHLNKLKILRMTMENWHHEYRIGGKVTTDGVTISKDSRMDRLFEGDLNRVDMLIDVFTKIDDDKHLLTKDEMYEMNVLFKSYGGKKINPNPW